MRVRTLTALILIVFGAGVLAWTIASRPEKAAGSVAARERNPSPNVQFQASLSGAATMTGSTVAPAAETTNLTDTLAANYLAQVAQKNSAGLSADAVKLPSQDTLQALVDGATIQGIDVRYYEARDILVGKDSSPSAERAYLESLDALTHKHFDSLGNKTLFDALDEFNARGDLKTLEGLIRATASYLPDVLALRVPPPLKDLHLAWLNLWITKLSVYKAIAGISDDPLKASVALQQIAAIVEEDAELQATLIARYNQLGNP